MIFLCKHDWRRSLCATLVLLAGTCLLGAGAWCVPVDGSGSWAWTVLLGGAAGAAALAVDGLLQGVFTRYGGESYRIAFLKFAAAVRGPMRLRESAAGAVMAGLGEEPLFRGLLLPGALAAGLPPWLAVALVAWVFAAAHTIPNQAPLFWWWGYWEGVLFGIAFVLTGSLIVPMIAHALHDLAGYLAFSRLVPRAETEPAPSSSALPWL